MHVPHACGEQGTKQYVAILSFGRRGTNFSELWRSVVCSALKTPGVGYTSGK